MLGLIGYKIVEFIVIATPYPITYLIATFGAKLWFATGLNVEAIKKNFSRVLGLEIKNKKVYRLAERASINWLKNVADFLKGPIISKKKLKERVDLEGLAHLKNALKKGKGAIIITAHLGNFEWGACRVAAEGISIWGTSLVRKNKRVQKFFENNRSSKGLKTLYIDKILNIFRILKKNEVVAIPSDWDPTGKAEKPFRFFGKTAYLPTGAVTLALRSGAPLLPGFIGRKDKYTHLLVIDKPIELIRKGDRDILVQKNMEKVLKILEKYISSHLDEWELFHDIWEK